MKYALPATHAIPLLLGALAIGCGPDRVVIVQQQAQAASLRVPLLLRGQDTRIHLVFPRGDQKVQPGSFERDEVCYLRAGDFRIDCYSDGSSLNLGPNDSTTLLSDNPMWDIEPADSERPDSRYMRVVGVVFLIGSSVDRLPQALSDYLQNPGPHMNEATALARLLLYQKRVQFQGYARGGNFVLSVELTEAGQDKLVDAIDQTSEVGGPTQVVSAARRGPVSPRPSAPPLDAVHSRAVR